MWCFLNYSAAPLSWAVGYKPPSADRARTIFVRPSIEKVGILDEEEKNVDTILDMFSMDYLQML
jgi:hypothetical protein